MADTASKTVELEPAFKSDIKFDHKFSPTPRRLQLWKGGYDAVEKKSEAWQLGRQFLDQFANQYALKSFVQQAIMDNEVLLSKSQFDDPDYVRLSISVTRRLDRALSKADAHLARGQEPLDELTRAAFYIYYAQSRNDGR